MMEKPTREPSERLAGPGRQIYLAGAVALIEPGPAAAGLVVTDERGRMLAHRSQYLGHTTRLEATIQALLSALHLAVDGSMEAPVFKLEDADLIVGLRADRDLPQPVAGLTDTIRDLLAQLPGHRIEQISAMANEARPVALAPLVDWLPERARRAEDLQIRSAGPDAFEVESASQPGQVYRIKITPNGDEPSCQCADFEYRGIPCKHLLAVARETGLLDQLFYRTPTRSAAGAER